MTGRRADLRLKTAVKPVRVFLWSIVLVPLLNAAYLLSLHLCSDPSIPESMTEQAGLEVWMLGGLLDALRHGRYPTGVEILSLPRHELLLSILLAWLLAAILGGLLLILLSRLLSYFPRRRLGLGVLLGTGIVILFLPSALALFPTPSSANIRISASNVLGPMPVQQRGFSQGGEIEMQQPGFFAAVAAQLLPLQPSLIRIDHVFDYYNVYQVDQAGQAQYDWSALDRVIDAILATGAKPLISLSYLPPVLAKDTIYGPPVDWAKWEDLVYQTVYHFNVKRRLNVEYWEVWNEPNTATFWMGTLDDYLRLYETAVHGALRADPLIKIGGPATLSLRPESAFALPFYEQNWIVTLARYTKEHGLRLDFVSWHYYEPRPDRFTWNVQLHQRWLADSGLDPELLITEWNRTGGWHPSLDSEEAAAYAAATLTTLADTPVRTAFFFEPFDSSRQWEGAWGMMRADRTIKPVYYAFQLAAQLAGGRLAVQSDHRQVGALAARNASGIYILLWNIKSSPVRVHMTIDGLPPNSTVEVTTSGVDAEHGNSYRGYGSGDLLIGRQNGQADGSGEWLATIDMPASGLRLVEMRH